MATIDVRIDNQQLQTARRNGNYQLTQHMRPRNLLGQITAVLLQPGVFFRTLPALQDTRQWLWVALLILGLVGISAVRQESLAATTNTDSGFAPTPGDTGAPVSGGAGIDVGGGLPPEAGAPTGGVSEPSADIAGTWTTALISASNVLFGWFILTILLSEVSLFNGTAPRLGQNLQIAVWSSVPLGFMAALQLLFYAAGGTAGRGGVSGLFLDWPGYHDLPAFVQSLLLSLTSRLTLFWLWSLVLIYIGARQTLRGKGWAVALVVIAWIAVVVVSPVVTGAIQPEAPAAEGDLNMVPADMTETPGVIVEMTPEPGSMPLTIEEMTGEAAPLVETPDSMPGS